MAITYPLTPPSSIKPSTVRWIENNGIGISVSPYTAQQQVFDWSSAFWSVEVSIDPQYKDDAADWVAFLSALRGQKGTFYFGDTLFATPRGTGAGVPKVNGASQVGFTLNTKGWTAGSLVLKAGDMFQIGTSLYRNQTDATADGSGNVTLDIFPNAKGHANDSSIITSNAKGVFRLTSSEISTQYGDRNGLFPIGFSAVEAL
jgi:hypothetical protein